MPSIDNSVKNNQGFSIQNSITVIFHFIIVLYLSFVTPFIIRYYYAAKFLEIEKPLEFTFQTCISDLSGVCSFPEALVYLEESVVELYSGYYHSFTLDLTLYDSEQNRKLGVFIANIKLKDESLNVLANYNKGITAITLFKQKSFFYRLFLQVRNLMFLPLYLFGLFAEENSPEMMSIKFPDYYQEKLNYKTKYITVQLQNKFIQIFSSKLRIQVHLGLWRYFISEYPITSHLFLLIISFFLYFVLFFLHWIFKSN